MTQTSGPIEGLNFTTEMWRYLFGDEPGIYGDVTGQSYSITLPTDSDSAQIGSATQDSVARVAGFAHLIPAGAPESVTIPAVTTAGQSRTDLIVLRYDKAWDGSEPGPVRLYRIAGTPASTPAVPAFDSGAPGVEDLPLWRITRAYGQSLSQVAPITQRRWSGPLLNTTAGITLGNDVPLGTVVHRGSTVSYRRLNQTTLTPEWFDADLSRLAAVVDQIVTTVAPQSGWSGNARLVKTGRQMTLNASPSRADAINVNGSRPKLYQLPVGTFPTTTESTLAWCGIGATEDHRAFPVIIESDGGIYVIKTATSGSYPGGVPLRFSISYTAAL